MRVTYYLISVETVFTLLSTLRINYQSCERDYCPYTFHLTFKFDVIHYKYKSHTESQYKCWISVKSKQNYNIWSHTVTKYLTIIYLFQLMKAIHLCFHIIFIVLQQYSEWQTLNQCRIIILKTIITLLLPVTTHNITTVDIITARVSNQLAGLFFKKATWKHYSKYLFSCSNNL